MSKHRSYCFTINNYDKDDIDNLLDMSFKYLIIGFEEGKKGTQHIQGYIQYWNPRNWSGVRKTFGDAHIEVAKGNPQQNIDYCSKDGEYYEFGERPTQGGRVTYEQIEAAMQDPHNNATIIRQYAKTYEQIKQLDIAKSDVKTKYYVIQPQFDAIQEVQEYFGQLEDITVITDLNQLGGYDNPKIVLFYQDYPDKLTCLYPRGVPIKYKYGYEYRTIKPEKFIIVTDTPKVYPLYKNI